MENICVFLALVLLTISIRGDSVNSTENRTALELWLENKLKGPQLKTFAAVTGDETHCYNELKKENYKKNKDKTGENITEKNKNVSLAIQRKSRNSDPGMECITCYGSGTSTPAKNCYSGHSAKTQKCAEVEQCFTELHPQYIKRGCTLPSAVNRTFVCKCPLCNDKTSEDLTYYQYTSISDWEYDNHRLEEPVVGMDLLCRVCDTKGVNEASDKKCRLGKNADYMQCGHNELCFINIDNQIDFVSRGCIKKPAYNALFYFCNQSKCNNAFFLNPRKKRAEYPFKTFPVVKITSSASHKTIRKLLLTISILFCYM